MNSIAEDEEVIFSMTIRTKDGRVIRRRNGRPFRFVVKKKSRLK